MRAVDIIRRKRDGLPLSPDEIRAFATAAATGAWPDYQLSALLMAIFLRGLDAAETAELTAAMTASGDRLEWPNLPWPTADKHSTGGVGDSTSLILVPLAASSGVAVPMISGRGLGHSGGTLDKLEAIPGFRVHLSLEEIRATVRRCGAAMAGQTERLAPADRALYALRDVTATVESIPLITASILSKKLAEGLAALVLDVKFGGGAFMKELADARRLAESLVAVARANGLRVEALLTDMNAPLGRAAGNALEMAECLEVLRGERRGPLADLSVTLAARMLRLAGVTGSDSQAEGRIRAALDSGHGLEKFGELIELQGGDRRVCDDPGRLLQAPHRAAVTVDRAGYVTAIEAEQIGRAAMALGAGREQATDAVDPAVGVVLHAAIGQEVRPGDVLAELHYRDTGRLDAARRLVAAAFRIGDAPQAAGPLIRETVTPDPQ